MVESYNSLEAASDRAIKKLKEEADYRKELAKLNGAPASDITAIDIEEGKKEIQQKELRRQSLVESAAVKRLIAADVHVATQEEDDKNLGDAKGAG